MIPRRGFSLIEAVVVIVIAGVILALAIPVFTDQESKASHFQEQVKAGVRYAQRQAVAQRRCVFVSVTATAVSLFYGDAGCAITGTPVADIASGAPYVLTAPSGVTIAPPTPAQFSFSGLGRPSAGVAFSVGGHSVSVEAETGPVL
jgi:MSHA pilin protein MshC